MKLSPWYLAALSPFAVLGCSGAIMGQLAILVVVLGIFLGTLSLNRARTPGQAAIEGRATVKDVS